MQRGYIDLGRRAHLEGVDPESIGQTDAMIKQNDAQESTLSLKERDRRQGRVVDVVLSDMSAPWPQAAGYSYNRSVSDPFFRMMNTSGNSFRDHAGSMVGYSQYTSSLIC